MSDRGLSTAAINALSAEVVEYFYLFKIGFSTVLYYTLSPYDIDYDGNTYSSSGIILDAPTITESLQIKPSTLAIKMSGASAAMHALTLTENYRNAEVIIYIHEISTASTTQIFKGFIDSYETTDDPVKGTGNVTWKVANHWSNWEATEGRFISDANQQVLYPGDLGLEFASIPPKLSWWGGVVPDFVSNDLYNAILSGGQLPTTIYYGNYGGFSNVTSTITDREIGRVNQVISAGDETTFKLMLPIIYGQRTVPGVPIFKGISGSINQYLWVVYAISEGECDDLIDITYDGKSYTHADISGQITFIKSNDFYSGSDTQTVDSGLVAEFTQWTTSHNIKGITCCVIKYTYNKNVWSGEPDPIFEIKGKLLYDPRDGSTAYSTNPALVLHDYLTSTGYGKSISFNDLDEFDSGADYCELTRIDHDAGLGGTPISINLFDFAGIISTSDSIKKNVEKILFTMRAHLPWINGKYTLVIERQDDTGTFVIDEDNLTGGFTVSEGGIKDVANHVTYDFIDADLGYQAEQVISESATFLAIDNNRVLKKSYTNKYETNRYRAQNRAATILKKSRQQLKVKCSLSNFESLKLEPGDIVKLTSTLRGWDEKPFRIELMAIPSTGKVNPELREFETSVYSWDVSVETDPPANTTLLDPFDIVAPTGLTLSATDANAIVSDDGTTIHRIKVTWVASADQYVTGYHIQYRENGATNYIDLPNIQSQATVEYYIPGVKVGSYYDVRIRSYNSLGKVSAWSSSTNKEITGTPVIGEINDVVGTDDYTKSTHFFHTSFESLDGFYVLNNASIDTTNGTIVMTGAPTNTLVYKDIFNPLPLMSMVHNTKFKCDLLMSGASNMTASDIFRVSVTQDKFVSPTIQSNVIGIQLDWNTSTTKIDVWLYVDDGTTVTTTYITSVSDGTLLNVEVDLQSGVTVTGTVNGTTIVQSSNIPDGTLFGSTNYEMTNMMYFMNTASSTSVVVKVSEYMFLQGYK